MIEYRLRWNASTNASFDGSSDWAEWGGFEETEAEVDKLLNEPEGGGCASLPVGLAEALEVSGFEWWAETRTV